MIDLANFPSSWLLALNIEKKGKKHLQNTSDHFLLSPDVIWYCLNNMGTQNNSLKTRQDVATVFTEAQLSAGKNDAILRRQRAPHITSNFFHSNLHSNFTCIYLHYVLYIYIIYIFPSHFLMMFRCINYNKNRILNRVIFARLLWRLFKLCII